MNSQCHEIIDYNLFCNNAINNIQLFNNQIFALVLFCIYSIYIFKNIVYIVLSIWLLYDYNLFIVKTVISTRHF